MLGKLETVDINIKNSLIQFSQTKEMIIYSKGNQIVFHNYETNNQISSVQTESKIMFFRFYEQGNLENTLVYLQDNCQVVYHNVVTNKKVKLKLKIDGIFSVDFDSNSDTIYVLDSSKSSVGAFDVFQRNQVNLKKVNLAQVCGFKVENFKHLKGDLIAFYGVQSIIVVDIREAKASSSIIETHYPITTVAYDGSANKIAIGTEKGKITICSNFSQNKPNLSTYHWHSMPVGALKFMDSRTLLSGGEEAVLVFWFEGSNRKDFCPRLFGKINGIFLDQFGEKIAVRYQNNKISVHNASNYKLVCLINEIDTSFAISGQVSHQNGKKKFSIFSYFYCLNSLIFGQE